MTPDEVMGSHETRDALYQMEKQFKTAVERIYWLEKVIRDKFGWEVTTTSSGDIAFTKIKETK